MKMQDNCRELFLSGITDVYLYPTQSSQLLVPCNVAQILQLSNCQFGECALHIATSSEDYVVAESLAVKTTLSEGGNGTIYTYEVSGNVENGLDNAREAAKSLRGNDYYVVLKKEDGTMHLAYTLPNTFSFKTTDSLAQTAETRTFTISAKALSDLIPITLKG